MKYGVVLPGGTAAEQLEQAILAEEAGWDGVFVWEAAYGIDAWALLGAMAVRTSHVRLGTMLTPLPWRRPWKVASEAVTLDQLSGGRAILAVGLGAVSTDLPDTGEVTDLPRESRVPGRGHRPRAEPVVRRDEVRRAALSLWLRARRPRVRGAARAGAHPHLGGRRLAAAPLDATRLAV